MKTTAYGRSRCVGAGGQPCGGAGPRGEVHGEQAGEEHQLAGEPDDRADADHVRSGQGVHPRGVEGAARRRGPLSRRHHGIGTGSGHDRGCDGVAGKVISSRPAPREPAVAGTGRRGRATRLARREPRTPSTAAPATVLVYSHRAEVRDAVRTAVGRRPASDVGPITWIECADRRRGRRRGRPRRHRPVHPRRRGAAHRRPGAGPPARGGGRRPAAGLRPHRPPARPLAGALVAWPRARCPLPVDPLTAPGVVADLLRARAAVRRAAAPPVTAPPAPGRADLARPAQPAAGARRTSPRPTPPGRCARS